MVTTSIVVLAQLTAWTAGLQKMSWSGNLARVIPLTASILSTKTMRCRDCVLFLQTVLDGSDTLTAHLQLICNLP